MVQNDLQDEKAIWEKFASAQSDSEFYQNWLALQCHLIKHVTTAALFLGPPDQGPYTPVSVWPDVHRNIQDFSTALEKALTERRGLVLNNKQDDQLLSQHIAFPVEVDKVIYGLVVLEIPASASNMLQAIMRQLYWGSAWLTTYLLKEHQHPVSASDKNYGQVLDLVATSLEQESFHASAITLATELATQLQCDRVSVGFLNKHHMKVVALSHSAEFEKKANLISLIGHAMDEAYDQYTTIHYTEQTSHDHQTIKRAHQNLAKLNHATSISTVLLINSQGDIVGAMTFENQSAEPLTEQTVALCEVVAGLAGPILDIKQKNDKSITRKIGDVLHGQLKKFTGPQHVMLKLFSALLIALIVFFSLATGDYRVSAKTVIEGKVQRVIIAPFSGYIAEAKARHGDIVEKDQVLAILDDKDIKLERLKNASRKEQLLREYRKAIAEHDKAKVQIIAAQLGQVEADLELYDYQLVRTKLMAPFQGVIVSGDLSQSLDAPVDKGQVLFEIAPLDAYRVILQVDEREINNVAVGQKGVLALAGLPDEKMDFVVKKITPVSIANEGRNYFRVEAQLDSSSQRLRPGMEGVGKISIEERKLIWIWTHTFTDWLKLWVWSWWP